MSDDTTIQRTDLDINLLDDQDTNPNKMSGRAFDLLVDNMQRTGFTENAVVRPHGDRYRIVSGHHRVKAARYLGWETVPCAVILDPKFDEEAELFQVVRMNAIRGKIDAQLFIDQYHKVAGKYGDEVLQDMFGFSDEDEFKRLIAATAKSLPDDLKSKFKAAAKEIKTIDGLAKLLNSLFNQYGDTVPHGYMVFDQGGTKHMWLRIEPKTFKALQLIGEMCVETETTIDDIMGEVVRRIAKGDLAELMTEIVEQAPKVVMPTGFQLAPTKDNLEAAKELA